MGDVESSANLTPQTTCLSTVNERETTQTWGQLDPGFQHRTLSNKPVYLIGLSRKWSLPKPSQVAKSIPNSIFSMKKALFYYGTKLALNILAGESFPHERIQHNDT